MHRNTFLIKICVAQKKKKKKKKKTPASNNARHDSIHGHNQTVNADIKFIIFFVTEDVESLNRQQKQKLKLVVAHIINTLL